LGRFSDYATMDLIRPSLETTDDVLGCALLYRQGIADFRDLMVVAASRRAEAPLYTFDQSVVSRLDWTELVAVANKSSG
ncbi:MAG: hypothetical protein OXL38_12515, partial [Gammaproteobacteria bacterium]|nr:hypothetical protein [Gammaproteobacteria bacterium]